MKFAPAEHKAINEAWKALETYAEIRGRMGEVRELREILARAKREMGDQTDARGLLLSMFVEATDDDKPDVAQIWQWPPYTREIKAYAWHTMRRDGPSDDEWQAIAIRAAVARESRIEAKRRASGLALKEWREITV